MRAAVRYKSLGRFGTIGLEIVLSILAGLWIGTRLDAWLGTAPWMAVLWFFFGCGAAVKAVHRSWRDMQAAAKREEAEEGNPAPLFPDAKMQKWKREEEALTREKASTDAAPAPDSGSEGEPEESALANGERSATKEPERRDG